MNKGGIIQFRTVETATGRVVRLSKPKRNLVLYGAADILAKLAAGCPEYKISAAYFEFVNVATIGDPISPVTYDRTGGLAYYTGLAGNPNRDYLRVPLTVPPGFTSTDGAKYSNNKLTFVANTAGVVGVNGKTFGTPAHSYVVGAALVAVPDPNDRTKDIVYARVYDSQPQLKEDGHQPGFVWPQNWT